MIRNKAFTLIELLVVIAIIALLSSIVIASLSAARQKARDASRIAHARSIKTALHFYEDKYGTIIGINGLAANGSGTPILVASGSQSIADVLVTEGFLPRKIASDSVFGNTEYYLGVSSDGRFDVYAKLERTESAMSSTTLGSGSDGADAIAAGYNYASGFGGGGGGSAAQGGGGGGGGGGTTTASSLGGLIHYWEFSESSGTTAADSVGSITASYAGGVATTSGVTGNGAHLRTDGNQITMPTTLNETLGDYSITFWVKPDRDWAGQFHYLYDLRDATAAPDSYMLTATNQNISYSVKSPLAGAANFALTIAPNQWTFVAVTQNATARTYKTYINGSLMQTVTNSASSTITLKGMHFGDRYADDAAATSYGVWDQIGIWNRELSPTDIGTLYTNKQ
jgi:prepilin-type N-terminal cleavage/methylation domain-containing protein